MKILKLSLFIFLSLSFWACKNNNNLTKNTEEEKEITKKRDRTQKNQETEERPSMKALLQGDWKVKEGMGFISFKEDTVDMNPMGVYIFSIDKKTKIISYSPIDDNGVAHKNTISKLDKKELILDPAGDSGQHEEYIRD